MHKIKINKRRIAIGLCAVFAIGCGIIGTLKTPATHADTQSPNNQFSDTTSSAASDVTTDVGASEYTPEQDYEPVADGTPAEDSSTSEVDNSEFASDYDTDPGSSSSSSSVSSNPNPETSAPVPMTAPIKPQAKQPKQLFNISGIKINAKQVGIYGSSTFVFLLLALLAYDLLSIYRTRRLYAQQHGFGNTSANTPLSPPAQDNYPPPIVITPTQTGEQVPPKDPTQQ